MDLAMRYLTALLLFAACSAPERMVISEDPQIPVLAGVDSLHVQAAQKLAERSFARNPEAAAHAYQEGQRLADLADRLLQPAPLSPDRDSVRAQQRFQTGAEILQELSESDSLQVLEILQTAAQKFEEALEADAFDELSAEWLARVYEILSERFERAGAVHRQIQTLQRLIAWNQDRHDYIALLAAAEESLQTEEAGLVAGALWERAALVAHDDAVMELVEAPDSVSLFSYYIRASRAFVQGGSVGLAQNALTHARTWHRTPAEHSLIQTDSIWLAWDDGNLAARKQFDLLLGQTSMNPQSAAQGFVQLLEEVHTADARTDVQHQVALATYASGEEEEALEWMQRLALDAPHRPILIQDYAAMSYNLAQKLRRSGDLKPALAYLLQCVSLDSKIAPRAAFELAILLRNNLKEAIKYAHIAESRMDEFSDQEQRTLIQYLAELYRRTGDRDRAKKYIQDLRERRKQN